MVDLEAPCVPQRRRSSKSKTSDAVRSARVSDPAAHPTKGLRDTEQTFGRSTALPPMSQNDRL